MGDALMRSKTDRQEGEKGLPVTLNNTTPATLQDEAVPLSICMGWLFPRNALFKANHTKQQKENQRQRLRPNARHSSKEREL